MSDSLPDNTHIEGGQARFAVTMTDQNGNVVPPDTIRLLVLPPNTAQSYVETTTVVGDECVALITCTTPGLWRIRFESTNPPTAVYETAFTVIRRTVPLPSSEGPGGGGGGPGGEFDWNIFGLPASPVVLGTDAVPVAHLDTPHATVRVSVDQLRDYIIDQIPVDLATFASPPPIGVTTPNTGKFTYGEFIADLVVGGRLTAPGFDGQIESASISPAGELIIVLADGTTVNAGHVVGPPGTPGSPGAPGAPGAPGPPGEEGPVGPISVVGKPLGTWDAATNTPTLSSGSGAHGDSYMVAVAGTTTLDGISTWAIGDTAYRGVSTWTRIPGMGATGVFDSITLPNVKLDDDGGSADGMVWRDQFGNTILRVHDDGRIELPGATFARAGQTFSNAVFANIEITNASVETLTAAKLEMGGVRVLGDDGSGPGMRWSDPFGNNMLRIGTKGEITIHRRTYTSNDGSAKGEQWVDKYGNVFFRLGADGSIGVPGITFRKGAGPAGLQFVDPFGNVFAKFDSAGVGTGFGVSGGGGGGGGSPTTYGAAELTAREGVNLGSSAMAAKETDTRSARPTSNVNHVVVYGQSLSTGAAGGPVLSVAAKYANQMFSTRTHASNSDGPAWTPVGDSLYHPLVAIGAETVANGALNTFRRFDLMTRNLPVDPTYTMAANITGVGGADIDSLEPGHASGRYSRNTNLIQQALAAATLASMTYKVAALFYFQGESDQTRDKNYYKPKLQNIINSFRTDAMTLTGQADPPAVFIFPTVARNTNYNVTNLGPQMAQLECGLEMPGVYVVGPNSPYPDSNNLHLPANSYRWLGSVAGKIMHRVLRLGQRWKPMHMIRGTVRGQEIILDFHVPVPPIAFEDPWLTTGWAQNQPPGDTGQVNSRIVFADKGFTAMTTAGAVLIIDSVVLLNWTQIKITLNQPVNVALSYRVRYADGSHFGHGAVRDSDTTLADDIYQTGVSGQQPIDNIPELSGAKYALHNWACTQAIELEHA